MEKTHSNPPTQQDVIRRRNTVALNAFSRILATLIFLILFGVAGAYLDRWLGTAYWIVVGFAIGMVFTIAGMIVVVRIADLESRQSSTPQNATQEGDQDHDRPETVS